MERVPQRCIRAHRHPATSEQCVALCTSTGVAAHATPVSMQCSVIQCGVAQRFRQQMLGVAEAKEDCGHGDGRRAVCRSSACVSSHEQSVRQHVHQTYLITDILFTPFCTVAERSDSLD